MRRRRSLNRVSVAVEDVAVDIGVGTGSHIPRMVAMDNGELAQPQDAPLRVIWQHLGGMLTHQGLYPPDAIAGVIPQEPRGRAGADPEPLIMVAPQEVVLLPQSE